MSEAKAEGLLKIFEFEKKSDLVRYCKTVQVKGDDFVCLILSCETGAGPFLHEVSYYETVPAHLTPSDSEEKALKDTKPGEGLGPEAAKWVSKITASFKERRQITGHMFYSADFSRWHFFSFDQKDIEGTHWKKGGHVHFINWLWPGQDAKSVWSSLVNEHDRPGSDLHVSFDLV